MANKPSSALIEAIAVTAELCGRVFSPAAAVVFANDLAAYDERAVIAALSRCRKEVKGILTTQDVISRIDDTRPGPEEAYAMLPLDEQSAVVWSEEMQTAWGIALPLIREGDKYGARRAFTEAYARLVNKARSEGIPARWSLSPSTDRGSNQSALIAAVRANRIPLEYAVSNLPIDLAHGLLLSLGVKNHPLLAAPDQEGQRKVRALLTTIKRRAA